MAGTGWYPIAASHDLPFRHVFHGQLLGCEFAVWRADDGYVNIWENRCLHRGVRLSIGINDGRELKCQYHGWRYSNRTAGCTYIPAHPADAPARTITIRTFPVVERYGLVWSSLEAVGEGPAIAALDEAKALALRGIAVNALAAGIGAPWAVADTAVESLGPGGWLRGVAFVAVAIAAPIGDLFESFVKRQTGVKDSGRLFGAHGGALDRLDATLFTVVAGYYVWLAILTQR